MTIPVDFGQVNWFFTGSCVPHGAQVTMGFSHEDSLLTATEAAEALYLVWSGNILQYQLNSIALERAQVKYGPDLTGPSGEFADDSIGGVSGAGFPPNVSLMVRKLTIDGGRAGRGRLYVPGIAENTANEGGVVDAGIQANFQTVFDELLADMIGLDLDPVVLHGDGSPLTFPSFVTAFVVDGTMATQRRRLRS